MGKGIDKIRSLCSGLVLFSASLMSIASGIDPSNREISEYKGYRPGVCFVQEIDGDPFQIPSDMRVAFSVRACRSLVQSGHVNRSLFLYGVYDRFSLAFVEPSPRPPYLDGE